MSEQVQARANEQSELPEDLREGVKRGLADRVAGRLVPWNEVMPTDLIDPAVADKGHRHELYTVGYYIRCHACGQEWSSAQQVYDAGLIDGRGQ